MKILIYCLTILFLNLLQYVVLPAMGLNLILPPLILPFALAWAETGKIEEASLWGIGALIFSSLFFLLIPSMFFCVLLAFALGYFGVKQLIHVKGRVFVFISVLISVLVYFLLDFAFQSFFSSINLWDHLWLVGISAAALSMLFFILYPFFQALSRLVDMWAGNSKSLLR